MLYHLFYPLHEKISFFNVFKYITLRSYLAFILAVIISIWMGRWFIALMKKIQFGQIIREEGPVTHKKKAGTPTSGGVFVLASSFLSLALCGNYQSRPFLIVLFVTFCYFLLGGVDDLLKVFKKNTNGISARGKLVIQFVVAWIAIWWAVSTGTIDTLVHFPFLKQVSFDLGPFFILFSSLVIVGSSNAVNLTDGLDGLAIGPIMTSSISLGILAYLAGHTELSTYLFIPYIEGAGELSVFLAAFIGAGMGFLWYNSYPAQIFMGDVGSLSMGGALGTIAVLTKNEFLFCLIGGVFVVEALSVIIQVISFKTRQKRVFKMAPIHHHFELSGWPEPKVIVRFWIVSTIFSILALATLKLR